MSRSKLWIADATAEREPDGKIVDVQQALVLMRQRMFFRPVVFCAPSHNAAYKAVLLMARSFFPEEQGYVKHAVSGLTELSALDTLRTLLSFEALSAQDVERVLREVGKS